MSSSAAGDADVRRPRRYTSLPTRLFPRVLAGTQGRPSSLFIGGFGMSASALADLAPEAMVDAALKEGMMAEAKLAPNPPDWMVEHANRYLASGGTDGHMYKINVPGRGEIIAPA